jgi:hypothetical protein
MPQFDVSPSTNVNAPSQSRRLDSRQSTTVAAPTQAQSRGRAALSAIQLIALQRSAGNRAVAGMLAAKTSKVSAAQTQSAQIRSAPAHTPLTGTNASDAASSVVQRAPKGRADQAANIAKLTEFRTNSDNRFKLATDYSTDSLAVGDVVHDKLAILSATYTSAYETFRDVLNTAQQDAQNQQMWTDIILGVVCGAAAGLLAAYILPSTAAGWFALTAAEAATAAASSTGQAVLSGAAALALSKTVSVEGKVISSEGLQPAFQELAMWKKVAQIYRSGLEVTPMVQASHALSGNLADRIGDLRVYAAGGKSDLTDAKIAAMVATLTQQDGQLAKARDELATKIVDLANLKAAAGNIDTAKSKVSMEREIWQLWMSTLPMNSNILDIDAIENHIGPKGLKIIDFGLYTTRADQNDAIDKARHTTAFLKAEAAKSDVPADPAGNLKILTGGPTR